MKYAIPVAVSLLLAGCAKDATKRPLQDFAQEFVSTTLVNSPVFATQIGYHRHDRVVLDALLDDVSPAAFERQRRWYQDFRLRLARGLDRSGLSADDRTDLDILQDQISLSLLELNTIQNYRHNPTYYVELLGAGLFSPYVLEYADHSTRYQHIIGRLERTPEFLRQARQNLVSAPAVWTRVAGEENDGNIALIEKTLRRDCPQELLARYDAAAKPAAQSLGPLASG